jgi:hypothetical protein
MIGTDQRRRRVAADRLIEHAAHSLAVDVLAADAEADDAAGKHVDGHQDPPAAKHDRLATKQSTLQRLSLACAKKVSQEGPERSG